MSFQDKVVVITGAAQGIGLETAKLFAAEGAIVAVNVVVADGAQAAVDVLVRAGGRAIAIPGSVADFERVQASAAEIVMRYGRIDVLVNNAGFGLLHNTEQATPDSWREVNSVVTEGTFFWSQAAATKSMIPNKSGAIVNVSSLSGLSGTRNLFEYVPAKHAVVGMTKALAVEWGRYNIRVNCVCPGVTDTPGNTVRAKDPEAYQARLRRIPIGRSGQPEEQAQVIAFLASPAASFVTGVAIAVDGGQMASYS